MYQAVDQALLFSVDLLSHTQYNQATLDQDVQRTPSVGVCVRTPVQHGHRLAALRITVSSVPVPVPVKQSQKLLSIHETG